MSFAFYLSEQLNIYPDMGPQDVFKLCFQGARGAEHLLRDVSAAKRYFDVEWERTEAKDAPLFEVISDDFCRVDLGAWKGSSLSGDWLFRLFVETAATPVEGDPLAEYLAAADEWVRTAPVGFTIEAWETALAEYRAAGTPAVHHSDGYREAYRPAYRVASRRLTRLFPILEAIAEKMSAATPLTVAIDGRAASGKTSLAKDLSSVLDAAVIHMDDFFLPPVLRTEARLAEAGGNVDYERFCEEVLPRLAGSQAFSYRVFDCGRMDFCGDRAVSNAPVRIVEGSYAHHPAFGDYAHVKVFSTVDAEEQAARILRRNGAALAERFRTEWIPREEEYFRAFGIGDAADLCV